jgi:galactokinase
MSMSMSTPPSFRQLFGGAPAVRATAPGRVNLIGEHTDYQDGLVLPLAIRYSTATELRPRADDTVLVHSAELGMGGPPLSFVLDTEKTGRGWLDYLQGITCTLRLAGYAIGGFEARIASTVPVGSGLSSSAALEVSLLRALRAAFGLVLDDVTVALIAHRSETQFVGVPVGVMDQFACSLGDTEHALFLDTKTLRSNKIPLPAGVQVLMIDSGIRHQHAGGEYRVRRDEAALAAQRLGVASLRDIAPDDLSRVEALPDPLRRRARHIVTENRRVLDFVDALVAGDVSRLGGLLLASHQSLRDDYQVSLPEIDLLIELAAQQPAVIGARLTGGGFGGCVVVLAEATGSAAAAAAIGEKYTAATGRAVRVLLNR